MNKTVGIIGLIDRAIERHQRFVRFSNESLCEIFEALEKAGREQVAERDTAETDA